MLVETLDNGLRVIVQENHSAPVVAIQVWVDVGSADDPPEMAGVAHVIEHMVFKGTSRRGVGEIAKEIEGAGGDINAWTSFDETVYHVVLASRFFDKGLEVLADAMQNVAIDPGELGKELEVIVEEIKEGYDSPGRVASWELFAKVFGTHPYGRPVIGHPAGVKALSKDSVQQLIRQRYVPRNMTVVIVGDVSRAKALARVRRAFGGGGATGRPAPARRAEPDQRRLRLSIKRQPTQEAHLVLGWRMPQFVHEDTPALDLAAIILGQGDSSRLVRRVRHRRQLVTDLYAYAYTPRDPGVLVVGASLPPEKLVQAVAAISSEVFSLGARAVNEVELRRAQTIIESEAVYQKETVQGQARKLGFYQLVARDLAFEQEYYRRVAAVSPERLREIARRYLTPATMTVSVVTPDAPSTLAKSLRQAVGDAAAEVERSKKIEVAERGELTRVKLPNGARLVFIEDRSVPMVAMRAVWLGGLRYETASNNGINAMLAALLTRGTHTRGADEINGEVESMAGSIGGFAGRNSIGIRAELLSRHWERGLEVLADCALNAALTPEEITRQRREMMAEIRGQRDDLTAVALQLFSRALYRKHPYRFDTLGSEQTVERITRAQLAKYYGRFLHPGRMVLAVVGDVDARQLIAKFTQLFGTTARPTAAPPQVPEEPARGRPRVAFERVEKEQAHVVIGFPGTTLRGKDRFVLDVIGSLLSGQGGRLFVGLRDQEGLAYRVSAFSVEGIEPGHFLGYIATSAEKIEAAIAGFEREFARLRDEPVGRAELARVKRYLVGNHEISLQRKGVVAAFVAFNEAYGLGYKSHLKYGDQIMAVTPADIQRVARKYLDPRKRVVAIVHPEELSPGAAKALGQRIEAGVVGRLKP